MLNSIQFFCNFYLSKNPECTVSWFHR